MIMWFLPSTHVRYQGKITVIFKLRLRKACLVDNDVHFYNILRYTEAYDSTMLRWGTKSKKIYNVLIILGFFISFEILSVLTSLKNK